MNGLRNYWYLLRADWLALRYAPVDSLLGAVALVIRHSIGLVFLYAIIEHLGGLGGWSGRQLVLLYAVVLAVNGLAELFFAGAWDLPTLVNTGKLDRLMVRPAPVVLQVLPQGSRVDGLGPLVVAAALLVQAAPDWSVSKALLLVGAMGSGALVIASMVGALHLYSFFRPGEESTLPFLIYSIGEMAKYPVTIFPWAFRALLLWVFPLATCTYHPAAYVAGLPGVSAQTAWLSLAAGPACAAVALLAWNLTLRRYESAG